MSPFIFSASRSAFCACLISASDTCQQDRNKNIGNGVSMKQAKTQSRPRGPGHTNPYYRLSAVVLLPALLHKQHQKHKSVAGWENPSPSLTHESAPAIVPAMPLPKNRQLTCVSPAGGSLASSISPINTTFSPRRTCSPSGISPYWLPTMMRSLAPARPAAACLHRQGESRLLATYVKGLQHIWGLLLLQDIHESFV